ncbi:MAG: bifunctional 4-hydroxy-3-methylbut-2-enyl diphosphate reductase/30S ribosomal protein S1 [Clostridia bacterium]|nr:bifunctional 4-hydroxy-3-methylbut-2-enyl diphosphate reductase/30S ribosomal protein S1 [Clostridia bacterium]
MMEYVVAKTAGFCFGVARALEMLEKNAEDGKLYHTLGPIIHNPLVVEDLAKKGITAIDSLEDAKPGATVFVRTHGVGPDLYEEMKQKGIEYIDLTCPFVKKIHDIVKKHHEEGMRIIIIGDKNHPEVLGISGWAGSDALIVGSEDEAKAVEENKIPTCIVAQTTFNRNIYKKIIFFLKKTCKNTVVFDTICSATHKRQEEALNLARTMDVMIVLGGRNSSNTQKLYDICKEACPVSYCLESMDELGNMNALLGKRVGITAGASTPAVIIKEAINKMENQEQSFATLFEESLKTLNTGDVVTGTVIEVRPNEVIVDLQVKQDGIIPASEISDDPSVTPEQVVKAGDEIEVFVVRVNDADGNIMLSRRKLDAIETWNGVVKAYEEGTILSGKIASVVNGGVIAMYKGVKVFIPASLASDRFLSDLSELVGKEVEFKLVDMNEKRRRVVGSVKAVMLAQKNELESKFWETAAVGNTYSGVVKSLTNFGAFVDLGGVDGLVHISELSWKRIKHPSEVVSVGDTLDVYIKDINEETKKISLGFKKAEDNPWEIAKKSLEVDATVKAKIVRMLPFGAFAEILPGIDGLIHISQIANKRIAKPQDELEIGQEVETKIVDINWETKKIGLSIRALLPEEAPKAEEAAPAAEAAEEEVPVHKEELGATIGEAVEE